MPDVTVSGNVDTMMRAANNAAIRSAIGLGQTDAPTFLGLSVTGQSLISNGTATNPAIALASNLDTGMRTIGGSDLRFTVDGFDAVSLSQSQISIQSGFASISLGTGVGEVILARDGAANILAQRNGDNAQSFRVYDSYNTAGANFCRANLSFNSNRFELSISSLGTGSTTRGFDIGTNGTGDITFFTSGANKWRIGGTSGSLLAMSDNAFDIGASGANRPRNVYLSGNAVIGDVATANGALTLQAVNLPQLTLTSTTAVNSFFGLNLTAGASPRAGLLINMSSGEVRIGAFSSSGYFPSFYSNNAEVMRFTTAGLLGIGTTTPASKLTVTNGDIEVDTVTSGIILKAAGTSTRYRLTLNAGGTALVFTAV